MTTTNPGPLEHRVGSGAFDARSLLTSLQNPLPTAIQRLLTRTMKAKKQIKHLLGITRSANCAG